MGNVREFPPELERKFVEAKEWADRHRELDRAGRDVFKVQESRVLGARILMDLVDMAEDAWGFGRRFDT